MLAIVGVAILVGLLAGGIALHAGFSILLAFGAYVLFGSLFILAVVIVVFAIQVAKSRVRKDNHAYSS